MKASRKEKAASMKRKGGRPRNGDRQVIPWPEIDRLLVFGEMVRDEETGQEDLRYPSQRELGRRYGVSGALIGRYSKEHQCMKRREENQGREQARFEQKVVEKLAEARAISTAEAIEIVDGYMRAFREALDEGRVRVDNASDFNTMMRLKAFLEGKADSRQEVQGITLEQMQERHRALRAQLESLDPAITGELPPRHRDRARGLLAEGADGDEDERPAAASRHRDDAYVERAPRRRVVAQVREGEFRDDVLAEEREESPRGNVRVLRSRADRDDDIEPPPRQGVVAHEREDELDDEVLAEEREESRRGDVRARRRRKPEHEDFDDDAELEEARVPRRARVVKPADVRALRRRSREELEDGRVSRRARSVEPARETARRPRRLGREDRAKFPAVVDARRPGRGWENEPVHTPGVCRPGRGWENEPVHTNPELRRPGRGWR
jgi:hypothetical protein